MQIEAGAALRMDRLPALPAQVVYYAVREAVRNAARYGRGELLERALCLTLRAGKNGQGLSIVVEDDGIGLGSPPENAANGGAGQGLALHSTLLAVLGGTLSVDTRASESGSTSDPSRTGTRVTIQLPREAA